MPCFSSHDCASISPSDSLYNCSIEMAVIVMMTDDPHFIAPPGTPHRLRVSSVSTLCSFISLQTKIRNLVRAYRLLTEPLSYSGKLTVSFRRLYLQIQHRTKVKSKSKKRNDSPTAIEMFLTKWSENEYNAIMFADSLF